MNLTIKFRHVLPALLIAVSSNVAAAISASTFMKDAAATLTSSRSVSASFSIEADQQPTVTGNIAVQGDKFAVTSSVNSTIYDGKTQWTISNADKEISIFEPTADEIAQVNPFAIIRNYSRDYNLKLISSDNSYVRIQLTPKNADSSIKSVTVTFVKASKLPELMNITLDDGTVLHVKINDITTDANIPASRFVVSVKNYAGYEIIDLR